MAGGQATSVHAISTSAFARVVARVGGLQAAAERHGVDWQWHLLTQRQDLPSGCLLVLKTGRTGVKQEGRLAQEACPVIPRSHTGQPRIRSWHVLAGWPDRDGVYTAALNASMSPPLQEALQCMPLDAVAFVCIFIILKND